MSESNGSSSRGSVSQQRLAHPTSLLANPDALLKAKILVVGAGGIGCEVLKNLSLMGVQGVQVIDLDTIDLSNLNRQFLFNKSHIKKSKSLIASGVASSFNPSISIRPFHANIKEARFGWEFFSGFDVVLNALDNLDARRWVNRMCIATQTPLIESGTTGFNGQVQPIIKDVTSCFDCTETVPSKTYPVCTIRSTPSQPIHCIVWAKTWLFNQLFGEDDETETTELDDAEKDGGNTEEINALRQAAGEMRALRESLTASPEEAPAKVFNKVFHEDIQRLLAMEDMWKHRAKPTPILFEEASQTEKTAQKKGGLRAQEVLGLRETVEMFEHSLRSLALRAASSSSPLSFDKDDEDALDFVTSSSNLRSRIYGIETKSQFDVKQMAGNIIPAIASTNAIIAGAMCLQMLHILTVMLPAASSSSEGTKQRVHQAGGKNAKDIFYRNDTRVFVSSTPNRPNPKCSVCQDVYIPIRHSEGQVTLQDVLDLVKRLASEGGIGLEEDVEVALYEGSRLLADPDFEDNLEKPLADLGIQPGMLVSVVDEDGVKRTVQLMLCPPLTGQAAAGKKLEVLLDEAEIPTIGDRPKAPIEEKGNDDDDDDDDPVMMAGPGDEDDGFFEMLDAPPPTKAAVSGVSGKKRKAEEEERVQTNGSAKRKSGAESNGTGDVLTVSDEGADDSTSSKRLKKGADDAIVLD